MARPFRAGFGAARNCQSRSVPRFVGHNAGTVTFGTSSVPPASSSRTRTAGSSDSRRATTEPGDPAPQTTTS
jgi:hypothetical protein